MVRLLFVTLPNLSFIFINNLSIRSIRDTISVSNVFVFICYKHSNSY